MDFSKKYLLKYGWEEGQGLGKTNNGIKTAIKPKLKFDKAGMGYDPSLEFTDSWWLKVYNDALEDTKINNEGEATSERNEDKYKEETKIRKRKCKEESFTDLFKACEGRTVHKGARQGLKLSGKLRRLEQQELKLLPKERDRSRVEEEPNAVKSNKRINEPINAERINQEKKISKYTKKNKKEKLCSSNYSSS